VPLRAVRPLAATGGGARLWLMATESGKRAVSPLDQTVFCPLQHRHLHVERCLECLRLVRTDENQPPRYIVCDASMLDRR
jgi:hypothetical protein